MTPGLYAGGMWAIALMVIGGTLIAGRRPRPLRARKHVGRDDGR